MKISLHKNVYFIVMKIWPDKDMKTNDVGIVIIYAVRWYASGWWWQDMQENWQKQTHSDIL